MIQFSNAAGFIDNTTTGTSLVCAYNVNVGDCVYVTINVVATTIASSSVIDNGGNTYTQQITAGARNPTHTVYTTIASNPATSITANYASGVAHSVNMATYSAVGNIGSNKNSAISPVNTTPPSINITLAAAVNWAVIDLAWGNPTTITSNAGNLRNTVYATGVRSGILDMTGSTSPVFSATISGTTNWSLSYIELVAAVPSLSAISPNAGTQGNTVPITLTGKYLTGTAAISVTGGGVTVSNLVVVNDSTVTASFAIASNATPGAVSVSLATSAGPSNSLSFTIQSAFTAPALSAISPSSGAQGTTVPVTITGINLTGATAVNITGSGVTVTNLVVVSATTITASFVIASGASVAIQSVTVVNPGGTSNPVNFEVQNAVSAGANLMAVAATLTLINN